MDALSEPVTAFVERAERFAAASGLELSTVARKLFNDGRAFDRVRRGRVRYDVLERANATLHVLELELRLEQSEAAA